MKLSPAAEIGIRGSTVLAEHYGEGPINVDSICAERDLPKQYLTKIFSSLNRAGLITAVRGKRGGYMLSRAPEEISLLQIIEAVQGPLILNYCTHEPPQCDREDCPMRSMWRKLQTHIREVLNDMTLANGQTPDADLEKL